MSLEFEKKAKSSSKQFYWLSVVTSIYLFFVVISFRNYFFFLPNFARPEKPIAFMQVMTTIGWVSLIFIPPLLLRNREKWGKFSSVIFLASSLIWPASTLIIKSLNYLYFGSPYVGYLKLHPLFLLMEFAVPVFYCLIWVRIRRQKIEKRSRID
jgi:hypothetical protein